MKAVFADTFYWIALSDPSDACYRDALAVESTLAGAKILTTEEVLSEFLAFFAADPRWRARASRAVQGLFQLPTFTSSGKVMNRFYPASIFTQTALTRATA